MAVRTYLAIDLKSFYASVECVERGLDPLKTNLVVADLGRTEKTICLAVSPPLKALGIPGRPRLFEVAQAVERANAVRRGQAPGRELDGSSWSAPELERDPYLAIDYFVSRPQMARYIDYSARIYRIYTNFVAPEDIHVYSIDEVFMDVTDYLNGLSARDFARKIIRAVLSSCGITATAGIGSNLYLCKVAMDILAKRVQADRDGVRIAELDERSYRRLLWDHRPLTDFWRLGAGYAKKLEERGIYTMGDIARCSLGGPDDYHSEELLYKLFGINAELLIDHAWGWENCTIRDIRAYRPRSNSISSGQVLQNPYGFDQARIVIREMADALSLELVEKGLETDQMELTVGYDIENLAGPRRRRAYSGQVEADRYGRMVPKQAHGSINLGGHGSSSARIVRSVLELYDRIVDRDLLVRRMYVAANHVLPAGRAKEERFEQMDLFSAAGGEEERQLEREKRMQRAILDIKRKYGKNAILRGTSYQPGATAIERNGQIGGHRA